MTYSENKKPDGLESKAIPIDDDVIVVGDSVDGGRVKKTTWREAKDNILLEPVIPTADEKEAMAGGSSTMEYPAFNYYPNLNAPSEGNKFVTMRFLVQHPPFSIMNTEENIDGSTGNLPVAVCMGGASQVQKTDASDANKLKFVGFVVSQVGAPNMDYAVTVQTAGVVRSFVGEFGSGVLTQGAMYYLSNTPGEISTTPGTNAVPVGIATSAAELLILNRTGAIIGTDVQAQNATLQTIATNGSADAVVSDASTTVKGKVELATDAEYGTAGALVIPASLATATAGTANRIPVTDIDGKLNDFVDVAGGTSFTAGEALTGATTPQPVYIDPTNGKVYKADADDAAKQNVIGFVVNSGATDDNVLVHLAGTISGFTGLTVGATYYVSDTAGAISTTAGTYVVPVGRAISASMLLIQTNTRRIADGALYFSDDPVVITTGFRPRIVRVHAALSRNYWSVGSWTQESGNRCLEVDNTTTRLFNPPSTMRIAKVDSSVLWVTNVTETGFTFDGDGSLKIHWTAEN
jgi:hypothetical protein